MRLENWMNGNGLITIDVTSKEAKELCPQIAEACLRSANPFVMGGYYAEFEANWRNRTGNSVLNFALGYVFGCIRTNKAHLCRDFYECM